MENIRLGTVPSYRDKPSMPVAKPIPDIDYPVEAGGLETHLPLNLSLRTGCYRITYQPSRAFVQFLGTLRVERSGNSTTISGDLYRFLRRFEALTPVRELLSISPLARIPDIPIYTRSAYYSYLKGTAIKITCRPLFISSVEITADEYVYTQPPAGAYSGTFGATPTRTVVLVLKPAVAPAGYVDQFFEGKLYVSGVEKGSVTLGWVSSFFRRATVEIDTLTGSVAPAAVPALSGTTNEDLRTTYATAGWDVRAVYDQTSIPVPSYVTNAQACWTSANLHRLMLENRRATTDLDKEWRAHLVIVPGAMGCMRGIMYDSIGVPREGAVAYSDDGYPATESAWFGTAANQQARNVPRAFMRTAAHEIGHVFNLILQYFSGEGGSDNSIMTTTPEVADVLQGVATGAPGVFPDNIALSFNPHCRNDLIHFPDIAVRPGGISFLGMSHSGVPEADYEALAGALELRMELASPRLHLGEPLRVKWTVTNKSKSPLRMPNDINPQGQHAFLSVLNSQGELRIAPSFVIATEHLHLINLKPGSSLKGETRLFWSTNGFAFEKPGRHVINLDIIWGVGEQAFGLKAADEVWVDYPVLARDNDMAATLLNPDVGMYVALNGGAHIGGALDRFKRAMDMTPEAPDAGPTALRGFDGILPKR